MKYYAILFFTVPGERDPKYQLLTTSVSFHATDKWDADDALDVFEQKYMDKVFNNCNGTAITPTKFFLSTRASKMLQLIRQIQKRALPEYQYDRTQSAELLDEWHDNFPLTPYNERCLSCALY